MIQNKSNGHLEKYFTLAIYKYKKARKNKLPIPVNDTILKIRFDTF